MIFISRIPWLWQLVHGYPSHAHVSRHIQLLFILSFFYYDGKVVRSSQNKFSWCKFSYGPVMIQKPKKRATRPVEPDWWNDPALSASQQDLLLKLWLTFSEREYQGFRSVYAIMATTNEQARDTRYRRLYTDAQRRGGQRFLMCVAWQVTPHIPNFHWSTVSARQSDGICGYSRPRYDLDLLIIKTESFLSDLFTARVVNMNDLARTTRPNRGLGYHGSCGISRLIFSENYRIPASCFKPLNAAKYEYRQRKFWGSKLGHDCLDLNSILYGPPASSDVHTIPTQSVTNLWTPS